MDRHSPYALVADDDALIRMDACEILKEAGFRCHDAATAEQAVELLATFGQNVQLLFTDVSMPPGKMTGFDLARHCAQNWPHIGILVASGGPPPDPGDMPDGALFIRKPFTPDVVREHLLKILPEGRRPEPLGKGVD
ncbi:response regulator [Paracoccus sediminis]|uniref:Response regulator n=1 Tax=Paracoccus sediminis TaxID=1214787 RepID=A0A238YAX4_9RHOB|nr:response regulator [Paracoccus sediminis]TBN46975.1 response regulator [Paracoccus sediminis]SNR67958.1 Response regulator receiver domain-containing protein [Paracoccus sediminis]